MTPLEQAIAERDSLLLNYNQIWTRWQNGSASMSSVIDAANLLKEAQARVDALSNPEKNPS